MLATDRKRTVEWEPKQKEDMWGPHVTHTPLLISSTPSFALLAMALIRASPLGRCHGLSFPFFYIFYCKSIFFGVFLIRFPCSRCCFVGSVLDLVPPLQRDICLLLRARACPCATLILYFALIDAMAFVSSCTSSKWFKNKWTKSNRDIYWSRILYIGLLPNELHFLKNSLNTYMEHVTQGLSSITCWMGRSGTYWNKGNRVK